VCRYGRGENEPWGNPLQGDAFCLGLWSRWECGGMRVAVGLVGWRCWLLRGLWLEAAEVVRGVLEWSGVASDLPI